MTNETHHYEYISQETDLDFFGHVNHANYLRIFEEARWDWISGRGFSVDDILKKQIGPTILEVSIQYKREVKHREKLRIESRCAEHKGKITIVEQTMYNGRSEVCATIKVTLGLFDMQKRKLVSAIPEWEKALGIS